MVAENVKFCIVIVIDILFSLYFTFLIILPDAGAISTSAAFLYMLMTQFVRAHC